MDYKISYGEKLFDARWANKRKAILNRDGYKCIICGKTDVKLQVHHKQYHFIKRLQKHVDPWDYDDKYLITLGAINLNLVPKRRDPLFVLLGT